MFLGGNSSGRAQPTISPRLLRPTCGIAQSSLRIAFQSRAETLPLPQTNVVQQYPSGQHTFPTPPPKAMAHQADFPCPLSAVPTANLSRPRSFTSVLNPVPPSQTSPWATASMPTSSTNGFGCIPRKPRLSSQRSSRCLLKCSARDRMLKCAAAIMSLIQSARNNGHDPYAYLKDVLTRLPTQRASEIAELLPHRWHPA